MVSAGVVKSEKTGKKHLGGKIFIPDETGYDMGLPADHRETSTGEDKKHKLEGKRRSLPVSGRMHVHAWYREFRTGLVSAGNEG